MDTPDATPGSLAVGDTLDSDPAAYQARVRPRKIAIVDATSGDRLSFQGLERRVRGCAGALVAAAGRDLFGERVAVLGRNSVDQVVIALACQRLGAIFVPLNWRLTAVELAGLVDDAAPVLLIYIEEFAQAALEAIQACPSVVAEVLEGGEGFSARIDASPPADPVVCPADAPCTLLYTSGTTGRPKGVIITRTGAFHACLNMILVGEVGSDSVMLCDVPLFHTVGLFAVTRTALTAGATLVLSDRFVPSITLGRLSDPAFGVTHYFGVPQMVTAMRQEPSYPATDLSGLKAIFTGGAPLPRPLVEAFLADGITLVNGYGMSEAGTVIHMPLDADTTRRHAGCIGYPAPTVSARIVDARGQDVGPGQDGELWIKGPAVTPGYWNQPQATAAAFTDGWFHTGDVARCDADGVYSLLDRRKDMYISGGENVYPAEVEAVLLAHPDVLEAAVIGAPHPRWQECGVAFLVPRPGAGLSQAEVLAHVDGRLARYKHPAHVAFVDQLPRTASGKVQKDVLRKLHAEPAAPHPVLAFGDTSR